MDTAAKNKVTYGLSNVHVWPITATSDAGVPTYGAMFTIPGAVELKLDSQGSSDSFYADDSIYYQGVTNTGYKGDLTIADLCEDFEVNILGELKDKNGALFEQADIEPKQFAIAFEFKGDAKKRRHLLYRCTAERPSLESKSKENKVDPNKPKLSFTAIPRLDNQWVKAKADEGDIAYGTWFDTAPYEFVSII